MKFDYNKVKSINFYANCSMISAAENEKIMDTCTIADKKQIHKILDKFEIEEVGGLKVSDLKKYWNPYKYYKSKKWIVVIHSCIEHFYEIVYK